MEIAGENVVKPHPHPKWIINVCVCIAMDKFIVEFAYKCDMIDCSAMYLQNDMRFN